MKTNFVYIWKIQLNSSWVSPCFQILDDHEKAIASGIFHEPARSTYIIAHGAIRFLAAMYIGVRPEDIEFEFNKQGKPALKGRESPVFNLTHSCQYILCAFAKEGELGIDVEKINRCDDFEYIDIARQFYSYDEYIYLSSLTDKFAVDSFFSCWTRKEAYMKAKGLGMLLPMNQFVVTVDCRHKPMLCGCAPFPDDPNVFSLQDLDVGNDYRACVAYSQADIDIQYYTWQGPWGPPANNFVTFSP